MPEIKFNYKYPENISDKELIELSRSGNGYATEFLLEKYRNFVRARSRTYFLIGADREDIIQEGMIGLYKAIRDYKPDAQASFKSFAELCITRQIITAIKTATRQKHIPLNSYISLSKPVYDDENERILLDVVNERKKIDPEEIMINKERFKLLEKKLSQILSKLEWKVLANYLDGKSYSEIAASVNKSEKSIDNALQRIKKKIEKNIINDETYYN
ncbi:MAG: RNA polymerase sporulation sigma factor SigH [Clostridia bacterium]|nr:RNA polymerase sporulation sigma factor SigH [Clostridia bacterium]